MTHYGGRKTRDRGLRAWAGVAALLSLVPLGLLACGPAGEEAGEAAAPDEAGTEAEVAAEAGEPGALDAESWLDGFSTGRAVDPEGAVPADSASREFAPGEVIYVSMEVGDAPAEAAVHVAFFDAAGEKAAEDEKKVPAEARYLYFDSGDTRHWEPGSYRVEIAVDGELVDEEELTLTEPAEVPGE